MMTIRRVVDILNSIMMCLGIGVCCSAFILSASSQDEPKRVLDAGIARLRYNGMGDDVISNVSAIKQWIDSHQYVDNERERANQVTREIVQTNTVKIGVIQNQFAELTRRTDDLLWWLRALLIGMIAQLFASLSFVVKTVLFKPPAVNIPCDQDGCPYHKYHPQANGEND